MPGGKGTCGGDGYVQQARTRGADQADQVDEFQPTTTAGLNKWKRDGALRPRLDCPAGLWTGATEHKGPDLKKQFRDVPVENYQPSSTAAKRT